MFALALAVALCASPVEDLTSALKTAAWSDSAPFASFSDAPFAHASLTKQQAIDAADALWTWHAEHLKSSRKAEWAARTINFDNLHMYADHKTFGQKPASGRSLFISMHGGGETSSKVNDLQWQNQSRLYTPAEGVYLAPRAPTDTWNMWHQAHIDTFFQRIIEDAVLFEDVNPDRVYLMGYSAGGDGVYQLAPRMADTFAAASMMAGHPNDAQPESLLNLPFAIHVGANDDAFNRNKVAAEWGKKLDALEKRFPGGYEHVVQLHEGMGHWMGRTDAPAVPWMATHTRTPFPAHIIWKQDDVTHQRFYWLANPRPAAGDLLDVARAGNVFTVSESSTVNSFCLLLNDSVADLDQPITIRRDSDPRGTQSTATRTISAICSSLSERADPACIFTATLQVTLPTPPNAQH